MPSHVRSSRLYSANRRRRPRFAVSVPVAVEGMLGTTRDLSADGVCFDVPGQLVSTGRLRFTIYFQGPDHGVPHTMVCEGSIVRATPHAGGTRLAVTLESCDVDLMPVASCERTRGTSRAAARRAGAAG